MKNSKRSLCQQLQEVADLHKHMPLTHSRSIEQRRHRLKAAQQVSEITFVRRQE